MQRELRSRTAARTQIFLRVTSSHLMHTTDTGYIQIVPGYRLVCMHLSGSENECAPGEIRTPDLLLGSNHNYTGVIHHADIFR